MDDVAVVETTRDPVREASDSTLVRQSAVAVATDVGFDESACSEIGLVATELASNIHKHATDGEVAVSKIRKGDRVGVRLESYDAGPGIDDVDGAFADGESTAGTLGGGLGAINRLMDQVTVTTPGEPDYGTRIAADRWLRPLYERTTTCPLSFGAASRPKTQGSPNGDSYVLKRWNDEALVGVIDGLGHGGKAHDAAMAAKGYVETHYDRPLAQIFQGTERACRGTRGVVMALARFDWAAESVTVATVGNVTHKAAGTTDLSVVPRRGVIGNNGPDPVVTTGEWHPEHRLVLFSDGVESHWQVAEHESLFDESATVAARRLLDRYGKDHDDATVVVVTGDDHE
jgi:anti-sigma regulatory factor (Ser/Thr protein kinase)/serine/threonine protein phosphatase PrpC